MKIAIGSIRYSRDIFCMKYICWVKLVSNVFSQYCIGVSSCGNVMVRFGSNFIRNRLLDG